MKRGTIVCLTLALVLLTALPVLAQGGSVRQDAFEQEIIDQLTAIDPEAVPIFQQATAAMDGGDLEAAQVSFQEVLALTPDFQHALRRLSYVEVQLEHEERGLQLARQAYAIDESGYNATAIANALLAIGGSANEREALGFAEQAVNLIPDDDYANTVLLEAGLAVEHIASIRISCANLIRLEIQEPVPYYLAGLLAMDDEEWALAEQRLLQAQDLGMSADALRQPLAETRAELAALKAARHNEELAVTGLVVLAVWAVGFVVLLVVGWGLSRLTMLSVFRVQPGGHFYVGAGERLLRTFYRLVIAITSLYYYISMPFLVIIVLAAALGMLYIIFLIFTESSRISLQVVGGLLLLALSLGYTALAVIRSIFTRPPDVLPGRPLHRQEAPDLWALAEDVAVRVDTRPIDALYITPGAEVAVTERGPLLRKLRGQGERALILGLGVLPGMTQGQLKAILAHEYGHFSNRDTAGGNLALQVRASMNQMAFQLASNGFAKWYNPAWLFINGFNRIFLRITLGASRLQEVLADRYAAVAYGSQQFVEALRHIVRQSLTFGHQVNLEANEAIRNQRALRNVYDLPEPADKAADSLEKHMQEVINRPTATYDSHPAVKDRIRLVEMIGAVDQGGSPDPVWLLLPEADKLQDEMTHTLHNRVQEQVRRARMYGQRHA